MKNKLFSFVLTFSLVFTMLLALTACGEQSKQKPVAEAIIIQNTANSKIPNLASPELEEMITEATSGGLISIINLDGNPQLVNGWLIKSPSGLTKSQRDKIAAQQTQGVLSSLAAVKAKADQVDILSGIQVGIRSLTDAPQGSTKKLVIYSTGLSTTGILDFTKSDFLDASPDSVAAFLSSQKVLPSLQGVQVEWYDLGDTAAQQTALNAAKRSNLEQLWSKIITDAGGQVTFSGELPGGDAQAQDYPPVTPVPILTSSATFDGSPMKFSDTQIQFIANTSNFVNPTSVKTTLSPVVNFMAQASQFHLLVVGETATGSSRQLCEQLSADRAEAVKNVLVSLGVPSDRIKTQGTGFSSIFHVPDLNPDRSLNENAAQKNRAVILIDADSAQAQNVLAANN